MLRYKEKKQMSSLRRSSSGGNLRSASPNVKRKGSTTKPNGKLSARSTVRIKLG